MGQSEKLQLPPTRKHRARGSGGRLAPGRGARGAHTQTQRTAAPGCTAGYSQPCRHEKNIA